MSTRDNIPNVGLHFGNAEHLMNTTRPISRGPNKGAIPLRTNRRNPDTYHLREVTGSKGRRGIAARMYWTDVVTWWADGEVWVSTFDSYTTRAMVNELLSEGRYWRNPGGVHVGGGPGGFYCLYLGGRPHPAVGGEWVIRANGTLDPGQYTTWVKPTRTYRDKTFGRIIRAEQKRVKGTEAVLKAAGKHPWDGFECSPMKRSEEQLAIELLEAYRDGDLQADPHETVNDLIARAVCSSPSEALRGIARMTRFEAVPDDEAPTSSCVPMHFIEDLVELRDEVLGGGHG